MIAKTEKNNLKGTFSAVAETAAPARTAANDDAALSEESVALARASVIREMSCVFSCDDMPMTHKLVVISAMADFAREDAAGIVRAQAVDQLGSFMMKTKAPALAATMTEFFIERLGAEPDVSIRQDIVTYLGDAVARNISGADTTRIIPALAQSAKTDSEHDVRARATDALGKATLENPARVNVLETTGIIADVARNDTNRYVRWGAAHLIKKIILSDVADKISVMDLAERLTGQRPAREDADIPGQIIHTIERAALEDSEAIKARVSKTAAPGL